VLDEVRFAKGSLTEAAEREQIPMLVMFWVGLSFVLVAAQNEEQ
jgi:hypothetical protein